MKKMQGVFRPDEMKLGRLVSRKRGNKRTDFSVDLDKKQKVSAGFSRGQANHCLLYTSQRKTDSDHYGSWNRDRWTELSRGDLAVSYTHLLLRL